MEGKPKSNSNESKEGLSLKPVIFLDIHGPISIDEIWQGRNTPSRIKFNNKLFASWRSGKISKDQFDATEYSKSAIYYVGKLVEEFKAEVVLSSSLAVRGRTEEVKMFLSLRKAKFRIDDSLIEKGIRDQRVKNWLKQNRPEGFRSFVCIDDSESWTGEVLDECVFVEHNKGITEQIYEEVRKRMRAFPKT